MRASDILYDIRDTQKAILDMKDQSDFLRASLYGRAIRYDVDKVQTTPTDITSDRLAEVCDRDARIHKRQKKLDVRKAYIRGALVNLPDEQARALDLYFLSLNESGRLYSWSAVAALLGLSEGYVQNALRFRAIKKLNEILY